MIAPNTPAFRDLFLLRPDLVYLNHGAFGACPRAVFERYQAWQRELETHPVELLGRGRRFETVHREARQALAAFIHVDRDDIIYHENTTTALNQVARSLRLGPGDEVLGNDHEYGAMDRAWRFCCTKTGARYIRAAIALPVTTPETWLESLWGQVTDRTRVIFISHVTSATALIFPVEEVCRRARAAGILTVVDGAHAPAYLPLDVDAVGADFYAGNCHKWLCSPKGAAFLYVRRDKQDLIEPLVVSWGWESDLPTGARFIDENEYHATCDPSAALTVAEAIEFQRAHAWNEVRAACRALCEDTAERIERVTGQPPIAPRGLGWHGQMRTLALPRCDVKAVKRQLYEEFQIEIPVFEFNERPYLRLSVQGYNTPQDMDVLVEGLSRAMSVAGVI